jgi:hypothetical protein
MFNLLGGIFGSQKALSGIVDGVTNGLDKLYYSDEEKAEDGAKERAAARDMIVEWMSTTKGQNLARRLLAMIITSVWLLQYIASMGLDLAAVWVEDSAKLTESSMVIGQRAESMNGAMMLILAFYFAAPHMGKIVDGALNKFGKGTG